MSDGFKVTSVSVVRISEETIKRVAERLRIPEEAVRRRLENHSRCLDNNQPGDAELVAEFAREGIHLFEVTINHTEKLVSAGKGKLTLKDGEVSLVGSRVKATRQITEAGGDVAGDPAAEFPAPNYIHAEKGEPGVVEHVDGDGEPTVRFDRTGTATVVAAREVESTEPAGAKQPFSGFPTIYDCGCSWLKVRAGKCDIFDENGKERVEVVVQPNVMAEKQRLVPMEPRAQAVDIIDDPMRMARLNAFLDGGLVGDTADEVLDDLNSRRNLHPLPALCCKKVEGRIAFGWGCGQCNVFNGMQRFTCKNCNHARDDRPLMDDQGRFVVIRSSDFSSRANVVLVAVSGRLHPDAHAALDEFLILLATGEPDLAVVLWTVEEDGVLLLCRRGQIEHHAGEEATETSCGLDLGGVAGICGVAKMNTPEPISYTSKPAQVTCPRCLRRPGVRHAGMICICGHSAKLHWQEPGDTDGCRKCDNCDGFVMAKPHVGLWSRFDGSERRFVPVTPSGEVDEHLAKLIAEKAAEADAMGIGKWGVREIPTPPRRPFSTHDLITLVAQELGISSDRIKFELDHDLRNDYEVRLIVKTHLVDNVGRSLDEQFDRVKVWDSFAEIRRKIPVTAKFIMFVEIDGKRFELEEHLTILVDTGTGERMTLIGRGREWYRLAGPSDDVAKTIGMLRKSIAWKSTWSAEGTFARLVDGQDLGKVQIRAMDLHTLRITQETMEVLVKLDMVDYATENFTVPIPPVKKLAEEDGGGEEQ